MFSRDRTAQDNIACAGSSYTALCSQGDYEQRSFCDYLPVFLILSFLKQCKFHPNFTFSIFNFLLLFFSYAQLCHLFRVVFMPELQEAFPTLTFIYLVGGVSVDLKADTHQIRRLKTQKTGVKQFGPEIRLMYLDLIKAFDTVS